VAGDPPSEIQTLVENHINRFNTQNVALFLGVFGDEAIIIDGIALPLVEPECRAQRPSMCLTKWGSGTWRAPMPSSRRR
jgi:hypothetical protein